jgi:hypothetical protein
MKKTICGALLGLSLIAGCTQTPTPNSSATPVATTTTPAPLATTTSDAQAQAAPDVEFSDQDIAQAEKLLAGWKDGQFDRDETRKVENARAFLFIAADSKESEKKAEAFRIIRELYADYESDKVAPLDDDFRNIVLFNLNNPDKTVQKYAIGAAYQTCRSDTLHAPTVDALSEIATESPNLGARWRAVLSLGQVNSQTRSKHPEIFDVYFKLYEDEGPVAAAAIDTTYGPFSEDEELKTKTLAAMKKLMEHSEPLVRGRALEAFNKINRGDQAAIIAEAKKMLHDGHPFVVAESLRILGETKDESLIPEIAKHLDDTRDNEIHLKFDDADGKATQMNDGGLTGKTVGDAATRALDKVTDGRPDKGFEAEKVGFGKEAPAKIEKNVAAAKEWVSKNGQ